MRRHSLPVNDALNKSKRKAGLPWQAWLGCFVFAGAVMAYNLLFGGLLLLALPAVFVLLFRKDDRIIQIACCAFAQKSYYDPSRKEKD